MKIRDALPEEWRIISQIAKSTGIWNYRLFYKYLARRKKVLVSVNEQDIIVGYTAYFLLPLKNSFSLQTGVLPEFQGFGVGSSLFNALLGRLEEAGCKTLYVHTLKPMIVKWLEGVYGFETIGSISGITALKKKLI